MNTTQDTEDVFKDAHFSILDRVISDGAVIFKLANLPDSSEKIEFSIAFPADLQNSLNKDMQIVASYAILLQFPNNSFYKFLSKHYNILASQPTHPKIVQVTGLVISQGPVDIKKDNVRIKIFFDDQNTANKYAEAFLTIYNSDNILEFGEKDIEYRENIIRNI